MKRREFAKTVSIGFTACLSEIVPEYVISARTKVKIVGSDKHQVFMECSGKLYANGREITGRDLEVIGRQAELGLCKIKKLVVE